MKHILLIAALAVGCDNPTPTGAKCPDPDPGTLTWSSFGHDFMTTYCTWCHDSTLKRSMRNGAPILHDFNTLEFTLRVANHTDEQAGWGPDAKNSYMPPDRCPSVPGGPLDTDCAKPTPEERRNLAVWLACEANRDHGDFGPDAGVDAQ